MLRAILGVLGLLAIGLAGAIFFFGRWTRHPVEVDDASIKDTLLTFETPYLNTKPEVRYVGDAKCAECHADFMEKYRMHPMFRTLSPVSIDAMPECYKSDVLEPFEAGGLVFSVEKRGNKVFHRETLPTADGRPQPAFETEIDYAIGSGSLGYSFLYERDGYFMQSPISWFSQKQKWALSPGYEHNNSEFQRAIGGECFTCHSNFTEVAGNAFNRYKMPLTPRGYGIGCERCHGPGELHVKHETEGDSTIPEGAKLIVNPKDKEMPVYLREAVCEQCHLEGSSRVLKRGRQLFDFRPGLPLHFFWSVFVKSEESGENQAVGQVEQMHESQCYKASKGALSCTSCHNPHLVPGHAEKVGFYRNRCLQCHADKGCSLSETVRRETSKEDNCLVCHMPRVTSTDVAHTATTNHRVPRIPNPSIDKPRAFPKLTRNPLVLFHAPLVDSDDAEVNRDLGIALATNPTIDQSKPVINVRARQLLENATRLRPDDVDAWIALGEIYALKRRYAEGFEAFEKALALARDKESALVRAGETAAANNDPEKVLHYFGRAIAINPYSEYYHGNQARAYAQLRQWDKAAEEARAAVKLKVGSTVRKTLIEALVHLNALEEAAYELENLIRLMPEQAKELRQWYGKVKP
jgi:hypothetical protein